MDRVAILTFVLGLLVGMPVWIFAYLFTIAYMRDEIARAVMEDCRLSIKVWVKEALQEVDWAKLWHQSVVGMNVHLYKLDDDPDTADRWKGGRAADNGQPPERSVYEEDNEEDDVNDEDFSNHTDTDNNDPPLPPPTTPPPLILGLESPFKDTGDEEQFESGDLTDADSLYGEAYRQKKRRQRRAREQKRREINNGETESKETDGTDPADTPEPQ